MNQISSLISFANKHQKPIKDWANVRETNFKDSFNVFNLFSDTYYRENFHSYFLAAILDPKGTHGEGDKFLRIFIELLNSSGKVKIDWTDFETTEVYREKGRIDISIIDRQASKAIIIENKINDAVDMERQLPRYYDDLKAKGFKSIEAIVYLPLDINKRPSQYDWINGDADKVNPRLIHLPAFNIDNKNLANGFMKPAIENASNNTVKHTLIQYKDLVEQLAKRFMEQNKMEDIIENWDESIDIPSLQQAANILNELGKRHAQRIKDALGKIAPFKHFWIFEERTVVLEHFYVESSNLVIDIRCYQNEFRVELWDRNLINNFIHTYFELIIKKYDLEPIENRMVKLFPIKNPKSTEKEVINFVKELAKDLDAYKK